MSSTSESNDLLRKKAVSDEIAAFVQSPAFAEDWAKRKAQIDAEMKKWREDSRPTWEMMNRPMTI